MIYVVDEDIALLDASLVELECKGYDVLTLHDADEGFEVIVSATDIDIVLIDIMLAVDHEPHKSRYNIETEEDQLTTGLQFLDSLAEQREDVFPHRAAILTFAKEPWLIKRIQNKCEQYRIPLLYKDSFASPLEFAERVEQIMQSFSQERKT